MGLQPADLLSGLPENLRLPLVQHYTKIAHNFLEHRWEPSELNAGKLCEVVYSILDGATSGSYPSKPSKPNNMVAACQALAQRPTDPRRAGDRSLRVLIPRVILALYEVRNNRGVGHVAGDVDSNEMDAAMVFSCANWVICELVRIFHKVTVEEASKAVSALVQRRLPEIWEVEGTKRVLAQGLRAREQTLLLLYSEAEWVDVEDIRSWIEYRNPTQYKAKVLVPLHKARCVEFDSMRDRLKISPKGALEVEEHILPRLDSHSSR